MLTALKQHATVKKGGLIELYAPELPEGTEVDVAAVLSQEEAIERDDTTYLRSSPQTHQQILTAMRNAKEQPENLVTFTMEEWNENYRI
ncbi:MAG: hypothetical protein EAZ92_08590 [Candidatus Kapaibacterium sp.]|nr:MAG: hypothetical protein EAZ92_08590 [Candidatus Kapabacteria bacterium]